MSPSMSTADATVSGRRKGHAGARLVRSAYLRAPVPQTALLPPLMAVLAAAVLWPSSGGRASSVGLPPDQLAYIVSGAHLKWTGPGDRLRAAASGEYEARNVAPTRMAMRHDGTIYLAMPKFKRGVPFTLGTIEYDPCQSTIEPSIGPFPCTAAHRRPTVPQQQPGGKAAAAASAVAATAVAADAYSNNNWTLVNVVDVYVDDSGILWALDVGKVDLMEKLPTVVRPPMVFAFDPITDEIVQAIDLSRATTAASCLQSIVVDHSWATGPLVYVSDAGLGNVIVYNVNHDRSFKVHVPLGKCGRRDVMHMALAQVDVVDTTAGGGPARHRRLYVTYLSSCDMLYVPVHAVDECTSGLPAITIGRKPCKMIMLGGDRASLVFFRAAESTEILSWNVNTQFCRANFRSVQRNQKIRTPLMVTVGFQGYLWYMESNYADFLADDIGCLGISTKIQPLQAPTKDEPCESAPISCLGPATNAGKKKSGDRTKRKITAVALPSQP